MSLNTVASMILNNVENLTPYELGFILSVIKDNCLEDDTYILIKSLLKEIDLFIEKNKKIEK